MVPASLAISSIEGGRKMADGDVPLLEARDLTVRFATGRLLAKKVVTAVDGVSISVKKGETLGLVGQSGSGKTTLARAVVKLVKPQSGSVLFKGADIFDQKRDEARAYRRQVQMIFQDPYESLNPRATAEKAIEEPLVIHRLAKDPSSRQERTLNLIRLVGLNPEAVSKKYPHELSGGERQRISIARALAVSPELLMADEPVSMLDVSIRIGIIELLEELKRKLDLTVVFITHDLGIARYFCDRIAVMYKGKLIEVAATEELLRHPSDPYTRQLLESVPDPRKGKGLPGSRE
jgi:ABC-type oligopeptide transport system ATPase subunit